MNKQSEKLKVKGEKYKICASDFEGITLVALVITIIVLIILAGVSINAVMNEGFIKNAKDAKNEYEEEKRKEEKTLSQLEIEKIQMEFLSKGIPYEYKNEYITNIQPLTKYKDVIAKFPKEDNYTIWKADGTAEILETDIVNTGMIVKKDGEEIGRILIYGDIDGIPGIDHNDSGSIEMLVYFKILFIGDEQVTYEEGVEIPEYLILSMDVDHNNIINLEDIELIVNIVFDRTDEVINQDVYAPAYDDIVIEFIEATEE